MNLTLDMDQLVITSFGALLGFVFAIILTLSSTYIAQKRRKSLLKIQLKKELEGVYYKLLEWNETLPNYTNYNLTIWNSVINTGDIFNILGAKDSLIFMKVYSSLKFLKKLDEDFMRLLLIQNAYADLEELVLYSHGCQTDNEKTENEIILSDFYNQRRTVKDLLISEMSELLDL